MDPARPSEISVLIEFQTFAFLYPGIHERVPRARIIAVNWFREVRCMNNRDVGDPSDVQEHAVLLSGVKQLPVIPWSQWSPLPSRSYICPSQVANDCQTSQLGDPVGIPDLKCERVLCSRSVSDRLPMAPDGSDVFSL